jgi:hypothetical protein
VSVVDRGDDVVSRGQRLFAGDKSEGHVDHDVAAPGLADRGRRRCEQSSAHNDSKEFHHSSPEMDLN